MLESVSRQQMSASQEIISKTLWLQSRANSTNAVLENNLVVAGMSDS